MNDFMNSFSIIYKIYWQIIITSSSKLTAASAAAAAAAAALATLAATLSLPYKTCTCTNT